MKSSNSNVRLLAGLFPAMLLVAGTTAWSADAPCSAVAFTDVRLPGHPQGTDAQLLGLAIRRGGVLATLDQRIAALTEPKSAEREALKTVA
jgi:hypothetical protein